MHHKSAVHDAASSDKASVSEPSPLIPFLTLFVLLVTVYTLTNPARFRVIDEVSLFAVTESLALRGEMDTNTIAWTQWVNSPGEILGAFGPDGQVYSKKGPAPAVLAVPWYWTVLALSKLGAVVNFTVGVLPGVLLWNGFVTAATAILLWLSSVQLGYSDRVGALLGLLFGLCTIAWPYATHFFGEPLSAFGLLLCFYGLLTYKMRQLDPDSRESGHADRRWLFVAGFGGAIVLATVTAHLLALGLLMAYGVMAIIQIQQERIRSTPATPFLTSFAALTAPIVISALLLLVYNTMRFGSPFDTGYHFDAGEGFTTPLRDGLWGLLLSPYRGLFWHTPLFLASPIAFVPFWRRHRLEGGLIAALTVLFVALYSTWWMWWGGFAWGPRFLVPLSPFLVLLLAPLVAPAARSRNRYASEATESEMWDPDEPHNSGRRLTFGQWLIAGLAGLSFVIQLSSTTVNYVNYEIALRSVYPTDWADPLAYGPPAQAMRDIWYSPVIGQWRLLFEDTRTNLDLAWLWQGMKTAEAEFEMQWGILMAGLLVLTLSIWSLRIWWCGKPNSVKLAPAALPLSLLIFILLWIQGVDGNPRLGRGDHGLRQILATICDEVNLSSDPGALVYVAPTSYSVVMHRMPGMCNRAPSPYGYAESSLDFPETGRVMNALLQAKRQIWFVTGRLPANSPTNTVERWLAEHAYLSRSEWYGDFRLLYYATGSPLDDGEAMPMDVLLLRPVQSDNNAHESPGEQVVLLKSVRFTKETPVGLPFPVEIEFVVEGTDLPPLRWFVQLLGADGVPVSMLDTAPLDGYVDFSSLEVGQPLLERAGLWIPAETPAGTYRLIAGLYDPSSSNQRMVTATGSDFVNLGQINLTKP